MKKTFFTLFLGLLIISCYQNGLFLYEDYEVVNYRPIDYYLEDKILLNELEIKFNKNFFDNNYTSYNSEYKVSLDKDIFSINNYRNFSNHYIYDIEEKYNNNKNYYKEEIYYNPYNNKKVKVIKSKDGFITNTNIVYNNINFYVYKLDSFLEIYKTNDERITFIFKDNKLYVESYKEFEEFVKKENLYDNFYKNENKFSIYDSPLINDYEKTIYNFKDLKGNSKIMIIVSPNYNVALIREDGKEFELYKIKTASGISYSTYDKNIVYTISKNKLYVEKNNIFLEYYNTYTNDINFAR